MKLPRARNSAILRASGSGNASVRAASHSGSPTPPVRPILKQQEIADPRPFEGRAAVKFVGQFGRAAAIRKEFEEPPDAGLDEDNAGRLRIACGRYRQPDSGTAL